jgi:rhodanese-related sulfurtransferase
VTGSSVDRLLDAARSRIGHRPTAAELPALMADGALVVDLRPVGLRERDGELHGAEVVDRNQLEWRLDPSSPHRLDGFDDPDRVVVLVCDEGYASSLAAASLRDLGLGRATDLDGGYQALLAAGLTDLR